MLRFISYTFLFFPSRTRDLGPIHHHFFSLLLLLVAIFPTPQVLLHGAAYAYVLFMSSNMISEGSELLLLTPYKDLVGSIVLPILGAVPDGAIILFSGSDQLTVGVGALAGSTIMLLTIPWFLAMWAGKVDLAVPKASSGPGGAAAGVSLISEVPVPKYSGKPSDRLSEGLDSSKLLFATGVTVDDSIRRAGFFMLLTSISYIVVQFPGFGFHCQYTDCNCDEASNYENGTSMTPEELAPLFDDCLVSKHNSEKPYIVAGLVLSILLFIAYIYDQVRQSSEDDGGKRDRKIEEIGKNALKKGLNLDFCVFLSTGHEGGWCCSGGDDLELHNLTDGAAKLNFDRAIVKLFNKYNTSKSEEGPEIIDSYVLS